jgi:hypothetical protein
MILHKGLQVSEPEEGKFGKDLAFIGDRVIHHHVKSGHPIAGNDQQLIIELINISDLPSFDKL